LEGWYAGFGGWKNWSGMSALAQLFSFLFFMDLDHFVRFSSRDGGSGHLSLCVVVFVFELRASVLSVIATN
jgi:hypothetical protein